MKIDKRLLKRPPKNADMWSQWLSDEAPVPTAQAEIREKRVRRANEPQRRRVVEEPVKPAASQSPASGGVSIQINIPEFHKPQFKRTKAAWRSLQPHLTRARIITISVIFVVLFSSWLGLHLLKVHKDEVAVQAAKAANQAKTGKVIERPTFTPVVPSDKQELITPDTAHSQFDSSKGSYSYIDTIKGTQFTVSQQKIPAGQSSADLVSKAAKSLDATTTLKTGWGTAYLETNAKYNSQSLVFNVRDLLLFIQCSTTLTNDQWTAYINSLD